MSRGESITEGGMQERHLSDEEYSRQLLVKLEVCVGLLRDYRDVHRHHREEFRTLRETRTREDYLSLTHALVDEKSIVHALELVLIDLLSKADMLLAHADDHPVRERCDAISEEFRQMQLEPDR